MKLQSKTFAIFVAATMVTATGCRFRSMSAMEQRAVVTNSNSGEPVPAWFSPEATGARPGLKSGGIIPETYSNTPILNQRVGTLETPQTVAEKKAEQAKAQTTTTTQTPKEELSPLARIAQECPTVEKDTAEAITIVDRKERIARYESIIGRCPNGTDLWLWLGDDYLAEKDFVQARRSYERALNLDPNSERAKKGMLAASGE